MRSTRIEDAPRLEPVKGAEMSILGSGAQMTLIKIVVKPGSVFPEHSHPNEQIGTCFEGEGVLVSGGRTLNVVPGVSWTIPGNERHSFTPKGDSTVVVIEGWSPAREDYVAMATKKK
jgi:quercetin dioxygenase-like cupin family protein